MLVIVDSAAMNRWVHLCGCPFSILVALLGHVVALDFSTSTARFDIPASTSTLVFHFVMQAVLADVRGIALCF